MNISSITGYTPIRVTQKVNFNGISMTYEAMKYCGLTDKDISEIDKRCPKNLNIIVGYSKHEVHIYESRKGEKKPKGDSIVEICKDKQSNKIRFMESINRILEKDKKR